jgi:hypothetical protein
MRFYTKQHRYYGGIDLHAKRFFRQRSFLPLTTGGLIRVRRRLKSVSLAFFFMP